MPSLLFSAEHSWEGLLQRIENREVIPVVGPDLSLTTMKGKLAPFYQHLAEALMQLRSLTPSKLKIGRNASGASALNAIFRVAPTRDRADLYEQLVYLVTQFAPQVPIPQPLQQLAQISHFDLFVSTMFDPLLVRALDEVRFGAQPLTHCRAYMLGSADQAGDSMPPSGTVAFYLLGRTSAWASFAVTEEDTLEFVSSIQATGRPRWLFDRLKASHLLLLGNSYPDWLGRFFLRLTKNQRLADPRKRLEIVADDSLEAEGSFAQFLGSFSEETRIYPQGAVDFVQQLHARWMARFGATITSPGVAATSVPEPGDTSSNAGGLPRGFIFLSYSREDQPAVRRVYQALTGARLNVWFDERSVEAGDPWNDVIRANIWKCSLYVPFFSCHTLSRREGVFWRECNWARERLRDMDVGTLFIVPAVIDDSGEAAVPQDFRVHHYSVLPGGQSPPEFVNRLIQLVRQWDRSQKGRPTHDERTTAT